MKRLLFILVFVVSSIYAVDYNTMSIDELNSLRGSVPVEDRENFRSAMQSKMQSLSPEERESYRQSRRGMGNNQRLRDGSAQGGMYKGSRGQSQRRMGY